MQKHSSLAIVLATIAVLVTTGSLLAGLRRTLGHRHKPEPELDPREAERRRIREALGDVVAPLDLREWPESLRPKPGLPDRDTLRDSMPVADRPAWHDLRDDRDSR
jgi:hypothetical protein